MDELLELLKKNALESPESLAGMLGIEADEVRARIEAYEKQGVIRGYQAVINEERLNLERVQAVIEVKVTPERHGGFDRVAARISRFPEVRAIYLMSGAYDLLVIVVGDNLREVAGFVSERLATIDGVISTATHFMLKTYKEQGVMMEVRDEHERLKVTP